MIYCVIFSSDDKYYLMCNPDDCAVFGDTDKQKVTAYFESGYDRKHAQSYEGSMSACVHFIMFVPKVIEFADIEAIKDLVGPPPWSITTVSCVAGSMSGFPLSAERAKPIYDNGVTPRLITNGVK